jgi:hypothetical protein
MPRSPRPDPRSHLLTDEVLALLEPDSRALLAVKCSRRPASCRCQTCLGARWQARDAAASLRAMPPPVSDEGPPAHVTALEWRRWLVWCEAARRMYGTRTPAHWAKAPRERKAAPPDATRESGGGGWVV